MNARSRYLANLKSLSDQLIAIQAPIRILDSIKWPHRWRQQFFDSGMRRLPKVDADFYQTSNALGFDPDHQQQAFRDLKRQIRRTLGPRDPLGQLLSATADQYIQVVELLKARGTPEFGRLSVALYGSARDHLFGDRRSLLEVGEQLCAIFSQPAAQHVDFAQPKQHPAEAAVGILQQRLNKYFTRGELKVILADGIVSDAAAGGDSIKLNSRSVFSERDLRVLEVHEGWVHVGTTLNGRRQPHASWLSVGAPRIAAIQEGLALLLETLTFSSFPFRARRVADRVSAIDVAEQGADFVETFHHLRNRGLPDNEAYTTTQRVFRGGVVAGGSMFTKDLSYVKGFVENVNFIRSAIGGGLPELIPMLFLGKVTLEDIPVLYEAYLEGIVEPPRYLPEVFRDLSGLYVWFGFSNGLSLVDMKRVQRHYLKTFQAITPVCPLEMAPRQQPDSSDPQT